MRRKGRRDGHAEQQKALGARRKRCKPHADPRLRTDGERLLSTGQTLRLAGLIALIYLVLIALSFPAVRLLRVRDAERGLYRFMFIFSNTGFLGYPVVESLLGSGAAFYVTIFVLFFQLFCWSYGASLMRGAARFRFQWKVLRQPCVAASLAAFAVYLSGWQPPALLHQTVKYVGDITSPVVMLIVDASLAQMRFKQIFGSWRIYALSALSWRPCRCWRMPCCGTC